MNRTLIPYTAATADPFDTGENYCYVAAANGLFLAKRNKAFAALVPVNPNELNLLPITPFAQLAPGLRLDRSQTRTVLAFGRTVFQRFGVEAFLWLCCHEDTGEITVVCPEQHNYPAHVCVRDDPAHPENLLKEGTIHFHPCRAFHSPGDRADEAASDGLHIVIGDLDQDEPSVVATLVVKGFRQSIQHATILDLTPDGKDEKEEPGNDEEDGSFPLEWLDKLHCNKEAQ